MVLATFSPFAYGLPIAFLLAVVTGFIGRQKGNSFWIWFAVGMVLPGIGLLAVLVSRNDRDEPERQCPRCGRWQKLYVQVCSTCGEDLYLPDPSEVRQPAR